MAEVKTADVKVGETYRHRYLDVNRKRSYEVVTVVGVRYDLMHRDVVTGFMVTREGLDHPYKVVPTTLETLDG